MYRKEINLNVWYDSLNKMSKVSKDIDIMCSIIEGELETYFKCQIYEKESNLIEILINVNKLETKLEEENAETDIYLLVLAMKSSIYTTLASNTEIEAIKLITTINNDKLGVIVAS